ncbi:nucleotide exchange factor GrpE [Dermacoccus barathri]|uniref:nucleotide exchange factor GrpE n=1 Tax=Dermacoccus barathri TaxID=322601 RepID=UPI0039ED1B11
MGSDLPGGEQPENLQTRSDEAATQAGPDATSADDAGTEHPDTKLAAERLSDLQRIQAEYVNYRNRVERDRAREKEATIGSVVESLIPVLDDIELARQHGDLTEGPMSKIADKIESTLNRFGVARFGEVNEAFDPSVHEALMHVEAEAPEGVDGTFVVQVLQPGYKVGERVVRPARVSVAG